MALQEEKEGSVNVYDLMLKAFRNPTKLSILLLLSRRSRMTVTEMAKSIKVTRSNLYHFVAELVKDGMLSEPEVVVKKNHIEKYYSYNPEFWRAVDPFEQDEHIKKKFTPEEGRELLQSMFLSLSLQFRMYADQISRASEKEIERISSQFMKDRLMVSYWTMGDEKYDRVISKFRGILKDLLDEEGKTRETQGLAEHNSVNLICIPHIFDTDEQADS